MITVEERNRELISSGLVDSIKSLYKDNQSGISDKYYLLIADYIDCIGQVQDSMYIDPIELAQALPDVLSKVEERDLGGIYGVTDENKITMNINNSYETNKLYFFHELTHALQTRKINNKEECCFYDGKTGMFFSEAVAQYTAEIMYHLSSGTNIDYREQKNSVRSQQLHTTYSPLNEYQFNGDILMLMSKSMDLPLPQILALGYKTNGRDTLKQLYESMEGNQNKFEQFMLELEQIYSIDKLIIYGYEDKLNSSQLLDITLQDKETHFKGNLSTQNELMIKVERELAANFILNHDEIYIKENYNKLLPFLTTTDLKQNFLLAVKELSSITVQEQLNQNHNK